MFRHPSMYEPPALEAAKFIINQRAHGLIQGPISIPNTNTSSQRKPVSQNPFKTQFFKTFSFRDIYSAIMVALLYLAINKLLDYYNDEEWLEDKWYSKEIIYLMLSIPLLHIFYKKEHRRSNDFIGRCIHMYLFMVSFIVLKSARDFILYQSIDSVFQGALLFFVPFVLGVVAIFVELFFSGIKGLFYLFKWRIW